MNKRGQATVLIILGLVIVASVITIYAFRDRLFQSDFERQQALALQIPEQAEELHSFISECVQEVVQEPITQLGQKGGYVDLPEDPIGQGEHNPFSNTLQIFTGTDFETAYWFYEAANGVPQNQIPELDSMEQEIADYVTENIADCTNNPELFADHNATAGAIFTEVEIMTDEIQVVIDYPVTVNQDDFTFQFPEFFETIDIPLGEMYETAKEIIQTENEEFYLEELTYDMFVLYDELPLSDSDISCDRQEWKLEDVTEDFKEVIFNNMLAVKVKNTPYDIVDDSDRNYFEWDAISGNKDYNVNIRYSQDWPLVLEAHSAENGVLREDSYTDSPNPVSIALRNLFCVSSYNFIYDIKYPVLITLYDENSDYTFQFATMVVLDNNQPRENTEGLLDIPLVEDSIICNDPTVSVRVLPVEVASNGDLVDLQDTQVSFKCINSLCPLGLSRGEGIETLVPQCINGQIIAEKEGYHQGVEIFNSLEETTVTVVLERFKELDYDIKVVDANGNVKSPKNEDVLFVTLIEEDKGYSTAVSFPKGENKIELIPGTYIIKGTLVTESKSGIKIPSQEYTTCSPNPVLGLGGLFGIAPDTDCVDVETEALTLDQTLSGEVDLIWELERDELALANKVTFYVTSPGDPENEEELEQTLAYLESNLGQREPELS